VTAILDGPPGALERSLARLEVAADAAEVLGLPTDEVRAVLAEARDRLGFPSDVYVLALVGGTGVGKSSLLNALAGSAVSPASVRRPTTSEPIAWVPRTAHDELAGLLAWLEVGDVREHDQSTLGSVAVLDLPDMDSVATAHRARVEQVLPKVDAVAWITDPEKYHDAILYDDFLRTWLARLARQAIVLNKSDRLTAEEVEQVRRDVQRDLREGLGGRGPGSGGGRDQAGIPVVAVSATAGPAGIREVADWLADGVKGKAIVRSRLAATATAHAQRLALAAGIDPDQPATPFLDPAARHAATEAVNAAVLRAIDLPALERQAVAATRAQARRRGTGPMGVLTSLVYRLSGREAQVADPDGFLVRWRERAPLAPAVEALRLALAGSLQAAAPAVRPALASTVEPARLRPSLEAAVDRAIARRERTLPSSRLWPVIGFLQTLATAATALSVAWIVLWVLARPPVDSVQLPVLGLVPMPFVALVVSLLVGYVLARSLGLHAGWVGRRWAGRLRREITAAVEREVAEHGLEPLDRLEAARRTLHEATRDVIAVRDDT
jgi:50S ribosome-binding GTPase